MSEKLTTVHVMTMSISCTSELTCSHSDVSESGCVECHSRGMQRCRLMDEVFKESRDEAAAKLRVSLINVISVEEERTVGEEQEEEEESKVLEGGGKKEERMECSR